MPVEGEKRGVKPRDFLPPDLWLRLHPLGFSLRHAEGPVEEITNVREDLRRSASCLSELKVTKSRWRTALDLGRPIRYGRERVPEESADGIFQCQSGSSVKVSTWNLPAEAFPEIRSHKAPARV